MNAPPSDPARSTRVRALLPPAAIVVWAAAIIGTARGPGAAASICAFGAGISLILWWRLRERPPWNRVLLVTVLAVTMASAPLTVSLGRLHASSLMITEAPADAILEVTVRTDGTPRPRAADQEWAQDQWTVLLTPTGDRAILGRQHVALPPELRIIGIGGADLPERAEEAVQPGAVLTVRGRPSLDGSTLFLQLTGVRPTSDPGRSIAAMRADLQQQVRIGTDHLAPDQAALVRGMAIGDTTGLTPATDDAMKTSGLTHLVAVSGANVLIVCACIALPLLAFGIPRRTRVVASACAVILYVAVVGPEPSLLRAATMAAPLLLSRFLGRRTSALNALALTILLWSALAPATASSFGFVLSALATGGILTLTMPAAHLLHHLLRKRIPKAVCMAFAVPLIAQAACTPVLILLRPEISLWSVPANMAAELVVAPTTVLAFIGVLLAVVAPAWAAPVLSLSGHGAGAVVRIAHLSANLPGAHLAVPPGAGGAVLSAVLILAVIALIRFRRRPVAWIAAGLCLLLIAGPGWLRSAALSVNAPRWSIAQCDVGQGDATVVRSAEQTLLIDTGPAADTLSSCLDALRIDHVDLLVLTHPHADHTGGVSALTGARAPAETWVCPLDEQSAEQLPRGSQVAAVRAGRSHQLGELQITVLWPTSEDDIRRSASREASSGEQSIENDCSIALSITWPSGHRLVTLGDLEPEAQSMLASHHPGPASAVKLAHHGSRRQHSRLYTQLQPSVALIGVGEQNTYGHPHAQTLRMLKQQHTTVLRTDQHGLILLAPDAHGAWRVWTQRAPVDSP